MATEKPQLISTSARLRVEQRIFHLERITIFTLVILIFCQAVQYAITEEDVAVVIKMGLSFVAMIFFFTNLAYAQFSERKVLPVNINPNPNPNPNVKTEATVKSATNQYRPYTQAEMLNDERIAFWIERFGISLFFILFFLFIETTGGARRVVDVIASLFFTYNFAYFFLFLDSEELYVQKNNKTSMKETNEAGGKGSQSCNSYASGSGTLINESKRALKETEDELQKLETEYGNLKASHDYELRKAIEQCKGIINESKKALKETKDELQKLETEYGNLKASHGDELRKAIEQCKGKYRMELKGKEDKLEEEHSKDIEAWKEYYQKKLNKKKAKREEELKKMKDEHEEDRRKWEEGKIHLVANLIAATATSEHYRHLLHNRD